MIRGGKVSSSEIDDTKTQGLYVGNGTPISGRESLILVLDNPLSATQWCQIAICDGSNGVEAKIRTCRSGSNAWSSWKQITLT